VISGGSNTFSGATRLDGGTLQIDNPLAVQKRTVDTRSGSVGSLSFGTQTAATFGGLTGSNNLALQNASSAAVALTVGGNGDSTTFGGILSGAGSLTKAGSGSLTLNGASTYAGDTAINAGTLVAGHANAFGTTGSVTIGDGAVLGVGAGVSFARPLSIPGTGRVSAGDQVSVILPTVAALAAWESPSPAVAGTFADILSGSGGTAGTRTLASSWTSNPGTYLSDILSLDGTGTGTTFVLSMTYTGSPDPASLNVWYRETVGDSFAPLGTSYQGVNAWSSSFATVGQYGVDTAAGSVGVVTDHNSQFVVVPEPSAMMLCGIAAAGSLLLARRRRGSSTPP
jgi:autotransporter-associated beta strand protein